MTSLLGFSSDSYARVTNMTTERPADLLALRHRRAETGHGQARQNLCCHEPVKQIGSTKVLRRLLAFEARSLLQNRRRASSFRSILESPTSCDIVIKDSVSAEVGRR